MRGLKFVIAEGVVHGDADFALHRSDSAHPTHHRKIAGGGAFEK
jgi:hypothetical protein